MRHDGPQLADVERGQQRQPELQVASAGPQAEQRGVLADGRVRLGSDADLVRRRGIGIGGDRLHHAPQPRLFVVVQPDAARPDPGAQHGA